MWGSYMPYLRSVVLKGRKYQFSGSCVNAPTFTKIVYIAFSIYVQFGLTTNLLLGGRRLGTW